ncbi:MAG: hypothetical protein IPO17_15585 [Flavobacteriales bacterium]|nr:hypothetical protein [Flavobacteriales bacterium]
MCAAAHSSITRAFKNQKEDHEALELVRLLRERYPALLAQAAAEERVKKEGV